MSFPSTFSSFTRPGATDRLNNPSHSSLHNTISSAIGQLEAVIGLTGNGSVLGSLEGDLRSPDSNGGGHVQTANKGGTGQTTYLKGDLLVATGSSVLSKLSVSSVSGQVLTVDSNTATGIKWGTSGAANNIFAGSSVVSLAGGAGSVETVLFATSILGSTLGTNKALHYTAHLDTFFLTNAKTFTFKVRYGNNTIHTYQIPSSGANVNNFSGAVEGFIVNKSVASQIGVFKGLLALPNVNGLQQTGSILFLYQGTQTASIESSANQDLIITGQFSDGTQTNSVLTGMFVVEKIA